MILKEEVKLKTQEGYILAGIVYRPQTLEKLPTLLFRTPYGKELAQTYFFNSPYWFAECGFSVFIQDVRGRGESGGFFEPIVNESRDGEISAEWVLNQNWSNQQILGLGYSYCGLNQFLTQKSSNLFTAISPALYLNNLFDGCLRQGQTVAMSFLISWTQALGGTTIDYLDKNILSKLVLNNSLRGLRDFANQKWFNEWINILETNVSTNNLVDTKINIPVLHLGGLYDTFRRPVVQIFNEAQKISKNLHNLVLGPWSHFPSKQLDNYQLEPKFGPEWSPSQYVVDFYREIVTLGPAKNSVGTVRVAVINDPLLKISGNQWPPVASHEFQLFLRSSGYANSRVDDGELADEIGNTNPDYLTYNHFDPLVILGGDDCGDSYLLELGPKIQNQNELRFDVLTYTTDEFTADQLFIGNAYLDLFYETFDERSQWFSRICLVNEQGLSINLFDSILTLDNTEKLNIVRLDYGPVSFLIKKRQKLRIQISNGAFPRWELLRDNEGKPVVQNSIILHNQNYPSKLTLPIAS